MNSNNWGDRAELRSYFHKYPCAIAVDTFANTDNKCKAFDWLTSRYGHDGQGEWMYLCRLLDGAFIDFFLFKHSRHRTLFSIACSEVCVPREDNMPLNELKARMNRGKTGAASLDIY